VERERAYTFDVTNTEGFCSQFNNYLYSYATAINNGRNLYVFDKTNAISSSFSLLKSTFISPDEVKFSDTSMPLFPKLTSSQTYPVTKNMPFATLKGYAKKLFEVKPEILAECNKLLNSYPLPENYDVGVHIRSGDKVTKREIPIERYIAALKLFQKTSGLDEMSIFVMTDSYSLFESLRIGADPSWTLYTIDSRDQTGYNHDEFRQLPLRNRQASYIKFLSELLIMRNINTVICTLSSNVGKWLYVNVKDDTTFKSLDITTYTPSS
jgi:hypothetical protein